MRSWLLLLLFACLFGCQKKTKTAIPVSVPVDERTVGPIDFDSTELADYKYKPLGTFYTLKGFKTFWEDDVRRKAAISVLENSYSLGFDPDFFNYTKICGFEKKYNTLSDDSRVEYDILLTYSLRKYLGAVNEGQTDIRKMKWNWAMHQRKRPITQYMIAGIEGDSLEKTVSALEPRHPVYQGLKKALAQIDALPPENFKPLQVFVKLRKGDSLPEIAEIKKRLIFWGDMPPQKKISSVYNKLLIGALCKFQKRHGLPVTGSVNKATVDALNRNLSKRRQQIVVNLERWRWFPHSMEGQYVLVNIPDYSLFLIKDNDTIDSRKVVVGKADRRTPVLASTFSDIILNPTWTVPPTIIKEDLGPDAAKDTNYFRNHRLTIYDWKKNLVTPSQWDPEKPNNYYYVQDPGSDNSLGNVKFNFPNTFMVYLHDTNHRDYFSRHKRSLSSGCVRVENPLPFAQQLINDEFWTIEKINEVVATKETTSVRLKDKTRIYQLYWTAWLNDRGQIEFRDDIYDFDNELYAALRPKL